MFYPKKWIVLLGMLLAALVSSCNPPIYYPDRIHTPLFEKEGDMELIGSISFPGFSGAAGYALTNHIALLGSLNHFKNYTDDTTYHNQTVIEGGVGYFGDVGDGWQCETDFIVAHCNLNYANDKSPTSPGVEPFHRIDAKYTRYALQIGLIDNTPTIERTKYLFPNDFYVTNGLLARLSLIHYNTFRDSSYYWPEKETNIYNRRNNQLYLELLYQSIFHAWHPYLSIVVQFGFVLPVRGTNDELDFYPGMVSAGLRFYFNRHFF